MLVVRNESTVLNHLERGAVVKQDRQFEQHVSHFLILSDWRNENLAISAITKSEHTSKTCKNNNHPFVDQTTAAYSDTMPSIEISLSSDSHCPYDSNGNEQRSASVPSTFALHYEDKIANDDVWLTSKNSFHGDYVDQKGHYYHEVIEVSDDDADGDDDESDPASTRTRSRTSSSTNVRAPTNIVGQVHWMLQSNFASRAMPPQRR